VIGVNDLITFEGTSVSGLKNSFQEAVDDYVETCKALGKSPDKTYKGVFNVRVSSGLHRKIATFAAQNDITLNDFVRSVLAYAMDHEDISAEVVDRKSRETEYAVGA
jgi:predicted HicB family RNase H-like nuclease